MSGPYDYPMNIPSRDPYSASYPIYDHQFESYQNVSGLPAPEEGFGFWYRSGAQENLYRQDPQMYDRSMTMQTTTISINEATSTKHRRTRSGCFTCRSRRVKVS